MILVAFDHKNQDLWIAYAVEALYAEGANPLTSLMAEEGIAALPRELPRIVAAPAWDNVSLIVVGGMPETNDPVPRADRDIEISRIGNGCFATRRAASNEEVAGIDAHNHAPDKGGEIVDRMGAASTCHQRRRGDLDHQAPRRT